MSTKFQQHLLRSESNSRWWRYCASFIVAVIAVYHYQKLQQFSKTTNFDFDAISTYLPFAKKLIADGVDFLFSPQAAQVPVFSYVWPSLFGADLALLKQIHILLSVVIVGLLYRTGFLLHSRIAGVLCAFAYGASPHFFPYMPTASVEAPFIFFITLWLWALTEGYSATTKKPHIGATINGWFIFAGIVIGLATLTRATIIYFLPLMLLLSWWAVRQGSELASFWRGARTAHLIAIFMVLPILIKNILLFGLPYVSTGAGIAIWFGSNPLTYGMDPGLFNVADHTIALPLGMSHLDLTADRAFSAFGKYVLLDNPYFIFEMYAQKLFAFLFVTNREWQMPVDVLRGWRIVLIGLAVFTVPLARRQPIVGILLLYVLFQIAIHIPVLYSHRYSVSAIDLPLAILAALGLCNLIFCRKLWVLLSSITALSLLVTVGGLHAANFHYPAINIYRVPHEVLASYEGQNLPIRYEGFSPDHAGTGMMVQTERTGFIEIDLSDVKKMHRYATNAIVLDFKSVNSVNSEVCRGVYMQYRGLGQADFSGDRAATDKWLFAENNRIILGGVWHIRTEEPGVLRLRLQCQGMGLSFQKIEVIKSTVSTTYQARFFQDKNVKSWEEWANKR